MRLGFGDLAQARSRDLQQGCTLCGIVARSGQGPDIGGFCRSDSDREAVVGAQRGPSDRHLSAGPGRDRRQ